MAVGTQTAIINAPEHLKCKLLSGTFKDAALRWYMNLPKNSIESYADFQKKFIHQFAGSKHVKVTSTSLFSICQNHAESLRDYLARFSEATIKVSNPNQEMFVAAFHNGLRVGHFNESLAQKPASSMQEINKIAECYIKGEESNAEKRQRYAKEKEYVNRNGKAPDHQRQRYGGQQEASWERCQGNPYYQLPRREVKDYPSFKEYTPLNKAKVHVLKEILATDLDNFPPSRDRGALMGPDSDAWCAYHHCRGHSTEKCFRLRDLIEEFIKSGHLRKFIEDAAQGRVVVPKVPRPEPRDSSEGREEPPKARVSINTIAGGFSGGGESNSTRKRFVRRAISETYLIRHPPFPSIPE
ncbi:uncharacterized protein LOC123886548 [Trifolium pratense]|uniref:uncharacterized protein LOC123886548 n=1 Tax=Trifolium pratense TaxID=57577 RepID=UPI001E696E27|nr:uncharacterized protein LOC123886548 [Trifolium pratense]